MLYDKTDPVASRYCHSALKNGMELRFAHIADFVSIDANGKLTIVGAFDIVWHSAGTRPILFPPFYLVAAVEASIAEGADHEIEILLVDDDEKIHGRAIKGQLPLRSQGPGHLARGNLVIGFGSGVVSVPDYGDYYFQFRVDGVKLGQVRVSVLEAPARA